MSTNLSQSTPEMSIANSAGVPRKQERQQAMARPNSAGNLEAFLPMRLGMRGHFARTA
jgi:hypothetical protein